MPKTLTALVPLLALTAACAAAPSTGSSLPAVAMAQTGDPGAALSVASVGVPGAGLEWLTAPTLDARTAEVVRTAARIWGAADFSTEGVSITYTEELVDCDGVRAVGCSTGHPGAPWDVKIYAPGAPCVEATTLPHEIGHLVLGGDANHTDPRWRDRAFWDGMAVALGAGSAHQDAACASFLERPDALFFVEGKL